MVKTYTIKPNFMSMSDFKELKPINLYVSYFVNDNEIYLVNCNSGLPEFLQHPFIKIHKTDQRKNVISDYTICKYCMCCKKEMCDIQTCSDSDSNSQEG